MASSWFLNTYRSLQTNWGAKHCTVSRQQEYAILSIDIVGFHRPSCRNVASCPNPPYLSRSSGSTNCESRLLIWTQMKNYDEIFVICPLLIYTILLLLLCTHTNKHSIHVCAQTHGGSLDIVLRVVKHQVCTVWSIMPSSGRLFAVCETGWTAAVALLTSNLLSVFRYKASPTGFTVIFSLIVRV